MTIGALAVFMFYCPRCGETVVLPPQSPLGKYVGQQYQASGIWPIDFLCSRLAQLFQVPSDSIRLETRVVRGPVTGITALWQIDCECAHENCGANYAIYTSNYADESAENVARFLFDANLSVDCVGDHKLELSLARMKAGKLEF